MEMNRYELFNWLRDFDPIFYEIGGVYFLDRENIGKDELLEKISVFDDYFEASKWINIALIEPFLDVICGSDWMFDDQFKSIIFDLYKRVFLLKFSSVFGHTNVDIEMIDDVESGDFGLRLVGRC